ncbi:hypothetical protein H310_11210 [Aphanomyces invadans]|uniref:Uncharacterized protein n=1 Tax=Aphanomyces invadans TaxID=157072 RepID=A0A024TPN7_9STRA|nr:hypothetical protein H310_11210 [Aphanomyces invadans]ETV95312.1 hypothetical protein H310_11210 [Aphanomyces invadans]|eukprot:XP_008876013.1 hypothetical protein H310_11210 [Aphanomyces invadans]
MVVGYGVDVVVSFVGPGEVVRDGAVVGTEEIGVLDGADVVKAASDDVAMSSLTASGTATWEPTIALGLVPVSLELRSLRLTGAEVGLSTVNGSVQSSSVSTGLVWWSSLA